MNSRETKRCRSLLVLAAIAAVSMPSAVFAQGQQIQPNYRDTDIRQIIDAVGEATGRNFLVDPRVNARVTLISHSPMTTDEFYQAFLSVLQVHQFAAVQAGDVVKIVPDATVRQLPGAEPRGTGDEIVTETIAVQNVGAAQLVPILRPLIPQYGHLAALPPSNMLLISDRAANVARIEEIIRKMDQAGSEDIDVIPLENASADEVVRMLGALNQAAQAAGGAPGVQLAADERTNSVLISGSDSGRLRYRALVAHLDTPSEEGGDTRVRYLDYADAEDLATKLQTQFTGAAATPAQGGAAGAAAAAPQGGISIWADAGTNALIINAPARVLQDIMNVIDKIDIRRAQVKVDAIIAEVTDNQSAQLGITWALDGSSNDRGVGVTDFSSTVPGVATLGAANAGTTAATTSLPQGITAAVGRIRDSGTSWAAILNALRGDANTNIVSTPSIVTLDNEEAEIKVGQQVPFLTGSYASTGAAQGTVNPFQTIQRQEIGTRLKITPQINEGSGVKLAIEQETSSISQGSSGAVDLITNNRTITTSVFIEDKNILVLGGLIDDKLQESEQRVPGLGRIPGLGWLFKARKTDRVKSNLMVFIRPTILRDSEQASFETDAKYRYLRDLQLGTAKHPVPLMHDTDRPLLEPPASPPNTNAPSDGNEPSDGNQP